MRKREVEFASQVVERFLRAPLVIEQRLAVGEFARRADHVSVALVLPVRHDLGKAVARPAILSVQCAIEEIVVRAGHQFPQGGFSVLRQTETFHIPDLLRGSRAGSDTNPGHTPNPFHTRTLLF